MHGLKNSARSPLAVQHRALEGAKPPNHETGGYSHGCKSRGATEAIAPPRICQEGLNTAQAPQENDEIASLC